MHQFLENPEHAESAAAGIYRHVRSQFRMSQMVDAIDEFYSEILNHDSQATGSTSADRER